MTTINAENYLNDQYIIYPNMSMYYGFDNGYGFTQTSGDYKYHVYIRIDSCPDGQINDFVDYISEMVIIVEDISGNNSSQNLQGFFEFNVDFTRK